MPSQTIKQSLIANNQVEVLRILTNSILREIEFIRTVSDINGLDEIDLADKIQRFEIDLIRCALLRSGGSQSRAAKFLGIKLSTLNGKINRYGISPDV